MSCPIGASFSTRHSSSLSCLVIIALASGLRIKASHHNWGTSQPALAHPLRERGVEVRRVAGKPLQQGLRKVAHRFGFTLEEPLLHGLHAGHHRRMLVLVASTGRKAGVAHPTFFRLEVSCRM